MTTLAPVPRKISSKGRSRFRLVLRHIHFIRFDGEEGLRHSRASRESSNGLVTAIGADSASPRRRNSSSTSTRNHSQPRPCVTSIAMRRRALDYVCASCRHCSHSKGLVSRTSRRYIQISATPSSSEPQQRLDTRDGSPTTPSAGEKQSAFHVLVCTR